jgi:glycosyltransferase involved in cell wall biosynthesis
MARERSLGNVRFLDYQPKRELSVSLSAADLHLVPLDGRIVRYMMPSKLYGILASGTPLVAVVPEDCELAEFVRQERVGFVTAPGDPKSLADQIRVCADQRQELSDMGARARELSKERFDRRMITSRMGELLSEILGQASITSTEAIASGAAPRAGKRSLAPSSRKLTEAVVEQL